MSSSPPAGIKPRSIAAAAIGDDRMLHRALTTWTRDRETPPGSGAVIILPPALPRSLKHCGKTAVNAASIRLASYAEHRSNPPTSVPDRAVAVRGFVGQQSVIQNLVGAEIRARTGVDMRREPPAQPVDRNRDIGELF